MNIESPAETAVMQSESGEKLTVRKKNLIGMGGYSKVFEAKVLVDGVETRAAVKVIKVRKQISKQPDQIIRVSNYSSEKENENLEAEGDTKKPHVPSSVPLERIEREISYQRQFQENKFIPNLFGVAKLPEQIWIISEQCEVLIHGCYYSVTLWNGLIETTDILVHIFAPIVDAILFLHSKGFVHLDIKPDNMVVNSEGIPKLIDFGLCLKLNGDSLALSESQVKGSEFFMPPEVVRENVVSRKSDAFSFALSLTQIHGRVVPERLFYDGWGGMYHIYENKEDVEELEKAQSYLNEKVLEPSRRTTTEGWEALREDILNLVSIEVAGRGTLNDLAETAAFRSALEDWNKYPCDDSKLSKHFLRQRGYVAVGFQEEPDMTIQVSPILKRYEVYVKAD